MCGIVGYSSPKVSEESLERIRLLLKASQIRGKHATGCCFLSKSGLMLSIEKEPAEIFLGKKWGLICSELKSLGKIEIIAHTRYTTSGPEHPQPLLFDGLGICFNGVIEQSDPSTWEEKYGLKPRTTNDAELLHNCIIKGQEPSLMFPRASYATLLIKEKVHAFRNGKRPLWFKRIGEDSSWASTREIFIRALNVNPEKLACKGAEIQP